MHDGKEEVELRGAEANPFTATGWSFVLYRRLTIESEQKGILFDLRGEDVKRAARFLDIASAYGFNWCNAYLVGVRSHREPVAREAENSGLRAKLNGFVVRVRPL